MFKHKEKAFSFMEIMVSLAITGFIIAAASTYFLRSKKNISDISTSKQMKLVADRIEKFTQNTEAISFSSAMGQNKDLLACVFPDNNKKSSQVMSVCSSTDPEKQISFQLYMPPKDKTSYDAKKLRIAGTDKDPVYYDINGIKDCKIDDPKCVFIAKAYFWAICPSDTRDIHNASSSKMTSIFAKNCHRAQSIHIRFQLSHILKQKKSKNAQSGESQEMPAIPKDAVFWKNGKKNGTHTTAGASAMNVANLGLFADFVESCPINYTLIQVIDSKPVCECLAPYKEISPGVCLLENHKCADDERYTGTSLSGEPICKKVTCETVIYTQDQKKAFNFNCSPNGWINKIEPMEASGKTCRCEKVSDGPNTELGTWEYTCQLVCSFKIRCCRE